MAVILIDSGGWLSLVVASLVVASLIVASLVALPCLCLMSPLICRPIDSSSHLSPSACRLSVPLPLLCPTSSIHHQTPPPPHHHLITPPLLPPCLSP